VITQILFRAFAPRAAFQQPLDKWGALSYCTVKVTMTLCVIDPEIALTVTCVVAGVAGIVLAAG
jgi:hypothetical protein